ncbi:hypothetical protein ZMTM_22010 [Methyloradius palustris]|uniref:Uncharacterized protein n=1 Tax=Methyloradius palustris TaxID=2778876 RepID=A0A8D5GA80_9PROT|nr:hypothetical protein ZMTM_22010 [Methyloradius palustris]
MTLPLVGVAIFIIAPLWGIYLISKSSVDNVNTVMLRAHQLIFEQLQNVDYFYYGGGGGLAVDVKNQTFCFVKAKSVKDLTYKLVPFNEIKGWQSSQPGRLEYTGFGVNTGIQAEMKNQQEVRKQAFHTGLTVTTNQLDNHQIFIHMPLQKANAWIQLLTKAINSKDLAVSSPPRFFPALES